MSEFINMVNALIPNTGNELHDIQLFLLMFFFILLLFKGFYMALFKK